MVARAEAVVTKVNINGHSHQVEVEHDGDLNEVVAVARKLWETTVQPEYGPAGPGLGFQGERADGEYLRRGPAYVRPVEA